METDTDKAKVKAAKGKAAEPVKLPEGEKPMEKPPEAGAPQLGADQLDGQADDGDRYQLRSTSMLVHVRVVDTRDVVAGRRRDTSSDFIGWVKSNGKEGASALYRAFVKNDTGDFKAVIGRDKEGTVVYGDSTDTSMEECKRRFRPGSVVNSKAKDDFDW